MFPLRYETPSSSHIIVRVCRYVLVSPSRRVNQRFRWNMQPVNTLPRVPPIASPYPRASVSVTISANNRRELGSRRTRHVAQVEKLAKRASAIIVIARKRVTSSCIARETVEFSSVSRSLTLVSSIVSRSRECQLPSHRHERVFGTTQPGC